MNALVDALRIEMAQRGLPAQAYQEIRSVVERRARDVQEPQVSEKFRPDRRTKNDCHAPILAYSETRQCRLASAHRPCTSVENGPYGPWRIPPSP